MHLCRCVLLLVCPTSLLLPWGPQIWMPMNLDQLISVFEGASRGGRAAKPWCLGCDILIAMKPMRTDNSLFKEEYGVCISATLADWGAPDIKVSIFLSSGLLFPKMVEVWGGSPGSAPQQTCSALLSPGCVIVCQGRGPVAVWGPHS